MTPSRRFWLVLGLILCGGVASRAARADMCFGTGHPPDKGDDEPKDGAPVGLRAPTPRPVRFAGGGLVFAAALGGVWLTARRKGGGGPG